MIEFKTKRIEDEFRELPTKNLRLFELLHVIERYCHLEFNKPIVLTEILRTMEEQKALYAQTPNPPTDSPHMHWRAFDLRSTVYTDAEIQRLLKFINNFQYQKGAKPTALYHKIAGNAYHFHVQYA